MRKQALHHVVIVGGGPVGSVLALALQQHHVPFTMLEARAKGASHQDTRALALSYGSRLILENLGIWDAVSARATAINTIHISQRGGLGRTKLNAAEHGLQSLGYVLPYGAITQALDAVLDAASDTSNIIYEAEATEIKRAQEASSVTFNHANSTQTLQTALTVVADGGRSLGEIEDLKKETKEYGHDALVTKVHAELPHNHVAYERFTPTGPMALLPNGETGFSLVWTGQEANIHALLALDDETFLAQLHQAFGDRVGKFLSVEKRMSFPLKLSTLKPSVAPHLAVIGNAAQTMHPVAGQGFNVGMRDAWTLAGLIINSTQSELGGADMLANYTQLRSRDTRGGIVFTDLLVNMFNNDLVGLQGVRGAGLGLLELIKPAKNLLVSKMSFGK
jgi:2-octaprenyl-6-methoxyphenol hydroxylase